VSPFVPGLFPEFLHHFQVWTNRRDWNNSGSGFVRWKLEGEKGPVVMNHQIYTPWAVEVCYPCYPAVPNKGTVYPVGQIRSIIFKDRPEREGFSEVTLLEAAKFFEELAA